MWLEHESVDITRWGKYKWKIGHIRKKKNKVAFVVQEEKLHPVRQLDD